MTRIYLVRHGQTELNREQRFRGITDAPLNESGRAEAEADGRFLSDRDISVIHTSPVARALETAEIVGRLTGAPVAVEDSFTDIDYGRWQGLTVDEVISRFGRGMVESWRRDPENFRFPGGDAVSEVLERVGPAVTRTAEEAEGDDVAVVSHLAILKICFVAAMGLEPGYFWRVDLEPGSVGILGYRGEGRFLLEGWNILPR